MENKTKLVEFVDQKINLSTSKEEVKQIKNLVVSDGKLTEDEWNGIRTSFNRLRIMPPQQLLWVLQAIEQVENKKYTHLFFSNDEITTMKTYLKPANNDFMILKNAFPIGKNQWSCLATVQQLAILSTKNIIRVDGNLQRESVVKKTYSDEILKNVKVNYNRVKEISNLIESDKYNYNTVRLNLMYDFKYENAFYDKDNHTIKIPKGGDVIIPDGNHRILACRQAYYENPDKQQQFENRYFNVLFTFYNPTEVKDTIYQEWNTETVSTKKKKSMKTDFSNYITSNLRNGMMLEKSIANSIVDTYTEIQLRQGIISYTLLAFSIKEIYKTNDIKSKVEADELTEWLSKFLNYLYYLDDSVFALKNTKYNRFKWVYFIYISQLLRDNKEWKQELKKLNNEKIISLCVASIVSADVMPEEERVVRVIVKDTAGILKGVGIIV